MSIIGIDAEKDSTDLAGSHFTVEKEMTTEPPRRVAAVRIVLHLPSRLNDPQRARCEAASSASTQPSSRARRRSETDSPAASAACGGRRRRS
jgi:hypothetical protein